MPGISMRHFSCGSFISDYGIRQLALCLWVFVQREDAPCAGAALLKTSAKVKELWQYCLSPAVRVLSSSGAERTIYGPLLGFRGQKHISQSDSAKLNKSSAAEKRWMSAPTSPTLGVPAVFFFSLLLWERQICQNTVSLNRVICCVEGSGKWNAPNRCGKMFSL